MEIQHAQVLITGGSEGIGFALAARFIQAGASVLITGRNNDKLSSAATMLPGLKTVQNDIAAPAERERLADYVSQQLHRLSILINNAGIQRRVSLAEDNAAWAQRQAEIDILLAAPVHLNHLLIPLLLNSKQSMIVNVTSGGAYIPQAFAPVYSACKAAMHSYTMVLRDALSGTGCRVVELVPPAVQTGLGGAPHGAELGVFADKVFNDLFNSNKTQIGYGPTEQLDVIVNNESINALFEKSNARFALKRYAGLLSM